MNFKNTYKHNDIIFLVLYAVVWMGSWFLLSPVAYTAFVYGMLGGFIMRWIKDLLDRRTALREAQQRYDANLAEIDKMMRRAGFRDGDGSGVIEVESSE